MRRYPTHDSLKDDLSGTGMEVQSRLFDEIKLMLSKNGETEKDIINILKNIALERKRIQTDILSKKPLNIHKKHYQKRHVVDDKWGFLNAGFYSEYSESKFNSYNLDRKLEIYEDLFFDQLFNSAYADIHKNIYEKTVNVNNQDEKLPIDKGSANDLKRIINILTMLLDKTEHHGMTVRRMREINRIFKTQTLTLGQLRDILDQLDETKLWFYDLFNYTFMDFPEVVARKTGFGDLNPRLRKILEEKGLRPEDGDKYFRYIHEKILGDIMAESAILAQLDRFIARSAEIISMSQQIFQDGVIIERKKENMPYVDFTQSANLSLIHISEPTRPY